MPTLRAKLGRWKVGIAFAAVTVAFVAQGWLLKRQIDRNDTARQFNCIQRAEIDHRIAISKGLLAKHPKAKILHFGGLTLTRSFVKANLLRDQSTRQNMNILDCKEPA